MPKYKYINSHDFLHLEKYQDWYNETNDCTVVALAIALGMSYPNAHSLLEWWGRAPRRGIKAISILHEMWTKGHHIEGKYLRQVPVTLDVSTVGRFASYYNNGTFILLVRGHMVCLKNGILYDAYPTPHPARRVKYAYYLARDNSKLWYTKDGLNNVPLANLPK